MCVTSHSPSYRDDGAIVDPVGVFGRSRPLVGIAPGSSSLVGIAPESSSLVGIAPRPSLLASIAPESNALAVIAPISSWKEKLTTILIKFARYMAVNTALVGAYEGVAIAIDAFLDALGVDYGGTSRDISFTMVKLHPVTSHLLRYLGMSDGSSSSSDVATWAVDSLKEVGSQVALTGGLALAYHGGPTAVKATLQVLGVDKTFD